MISKSMRFSQLIVLPVFVLSIAATQVVADTVTAHTAINGVDDTQGPVNTGSVNVFNSDPSNGFTFDFNDPAFAHASGNVNGFTAVRAEGLYACGSLCGLNSLIADTNFSTSYTNNTAAAVIFSYDYLVSSMIVEVVDYAFVDETSGLTAYAEVNIDMMTTGGLSDSVFASMELIGGDDSHTLNVTGPTPTFMAGNIFGYQMGPIIGGLGGSLAPGETVTITTTLLASVIAPGFETGARAYIGDPGDLTAGGLSGALNIAAVPVPAAVWLFASGLLGLVTVARRKAA